MIKRNIITDLKEAMEHSPVVLIRGARQVGKSTLVEILARDRGYDYVTFDDPRVAAAARQDPMGFLDHHAKPLILDEIQRVPELYLPIKYDVDQNRTPGRYIVTGSAHPMVAPGLSEALVGRMVTLEMSPLSQGELEGRIETFIDQAFAGFEKLPRRFAMEKNDFLKRLVVGGYPAVQKLNAKQRRQWFAGYEQDLLQREVKELAQIEKAEELPHLLSVLATRAACLLNVADVRRSKNDLDDMTTRRYMTLLKSLFLFDELPAWFNNLGKRLTKTPKVLIPDTGLLVYLLNLDETRLANDPVLGGSVIENFVVSEIKKQMSWNETPVSLYHFRTQTGVEVDLVLEARPGYIVGVEVKSSKTVDASDFKGLRALAEIAGPRWKGGVVLYTGDLVLPFGDKMKAMPISAIWEL